MHLLIKCWVLEECSMYNSMVADSIRTFKWWYPLPLLVRTTPASYIQISKMWRRLMLIDVCQGRICWRTFSNTFCNCKHTMLPQQDCYRPHTHNNGRSYRQPAYNYCYPLHFDDRCERIVVSIIILPFQFFQKFLGIYNAVSSPSSLSFRRFLAFCKNFLKFFDASIIDYYCHPPIKILPLNHSK